VINNCNHNVIYNWERSARRAAYAISERVERACFERSSRGHWSFPQMLTKAVGARGQQRNRPVIR
jgi:hypothetical protein